MRGNSALATSQGSSYYSISYYGQIFFFAMTVKTSDVILVDRVTTLERIRKIWIARIHFSWLEGT